MRKNKKLLLAAIASMGVLAMGVGATSSFAWFTVSDAGTSVGTIEESVTIVDNETAIGGVKFTAVKGTPVIPTALELSDDDGETYLNVGGSPVAKPGVTFSNTYLTIPVSVKVEDVSGGASFADKIASLEGDSVVIDVTGAFTTNSTKSSCIKYKYSAAPAQENDGWKNESVTGIKGYTILGTESDPTTIIAQFNLYVGIDGNNANATEALAEDTLTITITPRYVAA